MIRALQVAVLCCVAAFTPLSHARAQDGNLEGTGPAQTPPGSPESTEPRGEVVFLPAGRPAPFAGFLLEGQDLARWRFHIETLEYRLARDAEAAAARLDVLLGMERARTSAAEERLTLRDTLWQQRVEQLASELREARRAVERGWWESPALWFAIGMVVAGGAVIGIAAAL